MERQRPTQHQPLLQCSVQEPAKWLWCRKPDSKTAKKIRLSHPKYAGLPQTPKGLWTKLHWPQATRCSGCTCGNLETCRLLVRQIVCAPLLKPNPRPVRLCQKLCEPLALYTRPERIDSSRLIHRGAWKSPWIQQTAPLVPRFEVSREPARK